MSGKWSQEQACQWFGVCDGRTVSDLAGTGISDATGSVISPQAGKAVFHVSLVVAGLLALSNFLEALRNRRHY